MAILLKEITIRYSPQGGNLFQLLRDYFAVFGLWQRIQTGEVVSERKAELINDVMHQVGKMTHARIVERLGNMDLHGKEGINKTIQKFNHAGNMENWPDFTAALSDLAKQTASVDRTGELGTMWRDAKNTQVSPSLWGLFGGKPPTPKKPEPKWKQFDKPMNARGSLGGTQQDLPMAGGQTDLPLAPGEKLPQMPRNLPKMDTPFASDEPKRLAANWEKVMEKFGYKWSEADNGYKNEERDVLVQVQPSNAVRVFFPNGKSETIPNLGKLFRIMKHNKNKRHKKEPAAQVSEDNFKQLYEFLYT